MKATSLLTAMILGFLLVAPSFVPISSSSGQLTPGQAHLVGTVDVQQLPGADGSQSGQGTGVDTPEHSQGSQAFDQGKTQAGEQGFVPPGEDSKTVVSPSSASPSTSQPLTVTPNLVLEGAPGGSPNPCGCSPPDDGLGVGPAHVFQMVNLAGIVYTKAGAVAKATFSLSNFFLLPSSSMTDPEVIFDSGSGRWFASIADIPDGGVQFAVSMSSDPTGTWNLYFVPGPAAGLGGLTDQPFIGTSDDKFVISVNDFDLNQGTYTGVQYWVFNKAQLVSGAATVNYVTNTPDPTMASLHPARHLTATSIFYMVTNCLGACVPSLSSTTSSARLVAISGTPPGAVTVTGNTFSIATSSAPPNAAQPGTSMTLATNDNRILSAAWESNNLWFSSNDACVPGGDAITRSCVRLIQITTSGTASPTKVQDFDYAASGQYFFYPAVSLSRGQLALVYGRSSSTVFPSLLVTGRLPTDSANTLQTPATIRTGTAPDTSTRYGDYFDAATDPTATPTSTFWVAGEYRASSGFETWNTAIARVPNLLGLVGYWPLDEGSGSTTADLSGNGNTGTLTNSPKWQSGGNCRFGNCLSFASASNQFVSTTLQSNAYTAAISVAGWIYFNAVNAAPEQDCISSQNGGSTGWSIYQQTSTTNVLFAIKISSGFTTATFTTSIKTGVWHHYVGTYDGANVKAYLDGVLVSTMSGSGAIEGDSTTLKIAKFGSGGNYCNARIDDVRVYNRALSAGEVAAVGAIGAMYGLDGYWPLDEVTGTVAHDLSGNGYIGTLVNSPTWIGGANCKFGNCLSFASAGGQFVSTTLQGNTYTSAFTISAWMYFNSLNVPEQDCISTQNADTSGWGIYNIGSSTTIAFAAKVGSGFQSAYFTSTATTGNWHLYTGTFDGLNLRSYYDGVLVTTAAASGTISGDTTTLKIGEFGGGGNYCNARIDDVRIYNRALSTGEVVTLAASGSSKSVSANVPYLGLSIDLANKIHTHMLDASSQVYDYALSSNWLQITSKQPDVWRIPSEYIQK